MPFGGNDWLALTQEPTLEPELPICDPHHHFWDFRTTRIPYGSAPAGGVGAIMVRALRLGRQAAGMALLLTCGSSQSPARVSRLM